MDSWSDYYPFGKESRGSSTSNEPKEQFTGKERDIEIGLDYFGARYYNAEIGRWTSKDPLAEKYPGFSPYNYSMNNPVFFIDPDGRYVVKNNGGTVTRVTNSDDNWFISMGMVPAPGVWGLLVTAIKAGQSDPSYPVSGLDWASAAIGGSRIGFSVAGYIGKWMSKEAGLALNLSGYFNQYMIGVVDAAKVEENLLFDEALFAAAEDAGLGKENQEGNFTVDPGLAKAGTSEVKKQFLEVSDELKKFVKDEKNGKFNLKSEKGVKQFKSWLDKNKGAFKKSREREKVKEKDEDKDE